MNSQSKQLRAYTIEDGLPQSQVYAMTFDARGYLWLGTQGGGLARFDGNNFKVFDTSSSLGSNYIHAIKASNDTLYVGTKLGLSVKLKSKFQNIKLPQVNEILRFNHTIYLLTNNGLYKLNGNLSAEKLKIHDSIDSSKINDLVYDGRQYWMATNNGLWQLNSLQNNNEAKQLDFMDYKSLATINNVVFAATFDNGILIIKDQNFEEANLIRKPSRINSVSIQNTNQLWVATDNAGVLIFDTETFESLFTIKHTNGLSTSHVREVISDSQANLWIGTSGGGFYKYFQNSFKHYSTETGLNGNRIYAVHHNKNGLWFSNNEAGLMRIDNLGIHDVDLPENFKQVKIKTITSDKSGNIWAGSDGKGLLYKGEIMRDSIVIDTLKKFKKRIPTPQKITKVLNTQNGFPFNWIRSIHAQNDTIWAATYSSGIVKFGYDPILDKLSVFNTYASLEGIEDIYLTSMFRDHKNRLWYTTQNGHIGYLKNETIKHLGLIFNESISINSIAIHNNTIFVGTAGNGIWWTSDDDIYTFKKLKGTKSLSSENVYQLIQDEQGYLWAGSEKGVDKIELTKDNAIQDVFFFGKNDGFLGIETCLNAVDKDEDGHLWFGAINGLTEYQPTEISLNAKKPKLFFEDIKVGYKSIDSILQKTRNSKNELIIDPKNNQISFLYNSVDVDHPNGIEYRYKLNDSKWSPWSTSNTQDFSQLNYGSQKFYAQARNYRWIESDLLEFAFYIERPLHKKLWFRWALIGFATLLVTALIYYYVKRLKRKNIAEQERLQLENHLLSLEQKALRLQMNPHFIFNVLNSIKAMAPSKPEKMNATVNNFATLLRETLVNSRKDKISLLQEINTLKHYIEVEQLMAEKQFNYRIEVPTDIDTEEILIPPMLVQPFVENAIRHGILKGPREGNLSVKFEVVKERLKVTIEDNGIGIYESQKQNLKSDHQSMALKVTQERLESISGSDALEIKEKKESDGTITGTIITFQIPHETDY